MVRGGEVLAGSTPPLSEIWELAQQNLAALPEPWKALRPAQRYPVRFSDELQALRREAAEAAGGRHPPASPRGRMSERRLALLSTLHDPQGRLLPALQERGEHLAWYGAVYVTVTDATHPALREALAGGGGGQGWAAYT